MKISITPQSFHHEYHAKTIICKHIVDVDIDDRTHRITGYGSAKCGREDKFNSSFGEQLSLQRAKMEVGRKIERLLLKYSERFCKLATVGNYFPRHLYQSPNPDTSTLMYTATGAAIKERNEMKRDSIRLEAMKTIVRYLPALTKASKVNEVVKESVKIIDAILEIIERKDNQ